MIKLNFTLNEIRFILADYGFNIYMNNNIEYAEKDTINLPLIKAFQEHLKQKIASPDAEESFTTALKGTYDGYASGKEPANTNIQIHVTSAHAPSNAQKNSDILKSEIEAKLTGEISTHTHAGGGGGLSHTQIMSRISLSI